MGFITENEKAVLDRAPLGAAAVNLGSMLYGNLPKVFRRQLLAGEDTVSSGAVTLDVGFSWTDVLPFVISSDGTVRTVTKIERVSGHDTQAKLTATSLTSDAAGYGDIVLFLMW